MKKKGNSDEEGMLGGDPECKAPRWLQYRFGWILKQIFGIPANSDAKGAGFTIRRVPNTDMYANIFLHLQQMYLQRRPMLRPCCEWESWVSLGRKGNHTVNSLTDHWAVSCNLAGRPD